MPRSGKTPLCQQHGAGEAGNAPHGAEFIWLSRHGVVAHVRNLNEFVLKRLCFKTNSFKFPVPP
jgi:hypothetical protein